MRCIPFLFFFLSASFLFAQPLDIYYDALQEKVVYVRGGDTITEPQVKRGETVQLHIQNYNNYLYDIEVRESSQRQVVYSNSVDTSRLTLAGKQGPNSAISLLGMLGGPGGMFNFDLLAQDQLGILGGLDLGGKGFANDEESQRLSAEMQFYKQRYETALSELMAIEQNLNQLNVEIEQKLNTRALQGVALREMEKVKYNPRFNKDQIIKLSEEYMEVVFSDKAMSDLNVDELWKISKANRNLNQKLSEAELEKKAYQQKSLEIQLLGKELNLLESDIANVSSTRLQTAFAALNQALGNTSQRTEAVVKQLESNKTEVARLANKSIATELEELIRLRYEYEELVNNDFSYTYRTTADQDATQFEISLRPKNNLPEGVAVNTRQLAPIKVSTNGGLKINASFGLGFGQFFEQPQSYFIRDSVILAEDKDSFVPMLSSFVHFYRHSSKQTTLGGTFGVGVPFLNNEGGQSIAFFLGPSLVLGGSQRVVLSGGIMGGRVETLAEGYSPGDVFKPELIGTPIPTDFRYQLGYFVGLSMNVVGNN